jgi:hypothetical protein
MTQPPTQLEPVELPPGLKWIAILLVLAILVGIVALTFGPTMLRDWRELQLKDHGTDATAVLLSIKDTGDRLNEDPVVQLTVEITPQSGGDVWRASIETAMSAVELPKYKVGDQVRVRYDPEKPQHVALIGPLAPQPTATPGATAQ